MAPSSQDAYEVSCRIRTLRVALLSKLKDSPLVTLHKLVPPLHIIGLSVLQKYILADILLLYLEKVNRKKLYN